MLSALRSGVVRSVLNGQGSIKVLAAVPSRDYAAAAVPGLTPGVAEGFSPLGHKIQTREEKMATWKYVNSVYFGPDRDMKNYPNPTVVDCPPVHFGFIPASWFSQLYSKTGVSGPYIMVFGGVLWLMSHEHMVIDHWFWEFPGFWGAVWFLWCHPMVGPKMKEWFQTKYDQKEFYEHTRPLARMRDSAEKDVSNLNRLIEETETHTYIKQAKEEGVGLQLEAIYRSRLQHAFTEVKKRLDYESEKASLKRQFEQDHMVNWIVNSVTKSITPAQEKESIKSCISALKGLAAKQA